MTSQCEFVLASGARLGLHAGDEIVQRVLRGNFTVEWVNRRRLLSIRRERGLISGTPLD